MEGLSSDSRVNNLMTEKDSFQVLPNDDDIDASDTDENHW
jgi:hypothetical protein